MSTGLAPRISRIGQLHAGDDGAGGLENEIRLGLVIDSDTVPPPVIETSIQVVAPDPTVDADVIPSPALACALDPPAVQDADTVSQPTLDLNVLLGVMLDQDIVLSLAVAAGASGVAVPAVQDADTVAEPSVQPGAVTVSPSAILDADTVPALTVDNNLGQTVSFLTIVDAGTVNGPTLDINVSLPATQDADTVPSPSLAPVVAPSLTQDADTVSSPTLGINIEGQTVQDADVVPSPVLTLSLALPALQDIDTVPSPTVAAPSSGIEIESRQYFDNSDDGTDAAIQDLITLSTDEASFDINIPASLGSDVGILVQWGLILDNLTLDSGDLAGTSGTVITGAEDGSGGGGSIGACYFALGNSPTSEDRTCTLNFSGNPTDSDSFSPETVVAAVTILSGAAQTSPTDGTDAATEGSFYWQEGFGLNVSITTAEDDSYISLFVTDAANSASQNDTTSGDGFTAHTSGGRPGHSEHFDQILATAGTKATEVFTSGASSTGSANMVAIKAA